MSDTGILDLIGKYAGTAVTTFVAGGAGAYLGSYLKKKGENLATHEDIDKLVDQVKAVTKATKEIEAKISDDVWSRQKRWEVQQAALLETLRYLADAESRAWALLHAYTNAGQDPTPKQTEDCSLRNREYMDAMNSFWRSKLATAIVCGNRIAGQLDTLDRQLARVRMMATTNRRTDAWDLFDPIQADKAALTTIIREELGFEQLVAAVNP